MTDEAIIRAAWPEYRIVELIGHGTYGAVYHVRNASLPGVEAAVKIIGVPADEAEVEAIRAEGLGEEAISAFFDKLANDRLSELYLMKRYQGMSHFVSIEDCKVMDRGDGLPGKWILIRMEKLRSLTAYLSDKTLSEEEVIDLGCQLCEALTVCHADGIIHRDIKPENIFVQDRNASGVLYKLGDFGASRQLEAISSSFSMKGTMSYMAPEIVQTRQYDKRADLYSLGLTLYKLMNGNRLPFLPPRKLFSHEDYNVAARMRLNGMALPPAADASPGLNAVLAKACAFDPKNRYATAAEFSAALSAIGDERPGPGRRLRHLRWILPACALAAITALLLLLRPGGIGTPTAGPPSAAPAAGVRETPVPMLTAAVPPSPAREAVNALSQAWSQFAAEPLGTAARAAELLPLARCAAMAPVLTVDEGLSAIRLNDGLTGWQVYVSDDGRTVDPYRQAAGSDVYMPPAVRQMEPEQVTEITVWKDFDFDGFVWHISLTYSTRTFSALEHVSISARKTNTGELVVAWLAYDEGEELSCWLDLYRGDTPPEKYRYTINEWRTAQ